MLLGESMGKRHQLTDLKVSRVALVDRGANQHAHVMLFKAHEREEEAEMAGLYLAKRKGDAGLPVEVEAYLKRDFSQEQRDHAAARGAALPDGSFPIENRSDLKNAVRAFGRAKDKAKAKAHIISRARALDATSLLPDDWKLSKRLLLQDVSKDDALEALSGPVEIFIQEMGAADFDAEQAEAEAREYACGLLEEIDQAVCSLRTVFCEINEDGSVTDKQKALQESLEQFKAHIQGIIPEGLENAMVAAALTEAGFSVTEGGALTKRETDDMGYSIELKKSLGLAITASDADVQKTLQTQAKAAKFGANVLKMSGSHAAYMNNEKSTMPDGGKEAFADMSADERDKHMAKHPIGKSDKEKADEEAAEKAKKAKEEEEARKRAASDEVLKVGDVEIRKSVVGNTQFAVLKSQQEEIAKLRDSGEISAISKRVSTSLTHIGKADEIAALLHGIAKSGPKGAELSAAVEKKFEQLEAVVAKSGLFTEVGKSGPGVAGTAAATITKMAEQMVAKGEAKSIYKAKDMVRRANTELAKQEAEEAKDKAKAA